MHRVHILSPNTGDKRRNYPTSLMHLDQHLRSNGFESEVLDCDGLGWSIDRLISYLKEYPPRIIGVTSYSITRFASYELIQQVRSHFPDVPLVVGGRHFAALAEETLERLPQVDYVVRGEGEETFLELCQAIVSNGSPDGIAGITFRRDHRTVSNPDRPAPRHLDDLQFSYDRIKGDYSPLYRMVKSPIHKDAIGIKVGRGCVGRCIFCCTSSTKLRFRSIDRVIEEIEFLSQKTGCQHVTFLDETLTADKRYLSAFCQTLIDRKIGIHWTCNSRVDIDFSILQLMKRAGCISVNIGLESGSPKVLKTIKKNIKLDDYFGMIRNCADLGISVWVFCMVSFPDETEQEAMETLRVVEESASFIYKPALQLARIYPDAAMYQTSIDRNLLPPGFDWFRPYRNEISPLFGGTGAAGSNIGDNIPFYIEQLSIDFLQHYFRLFDNMVRKRFSYKSDYYDLIRTNISRTLFDWKNERLGKKIRRGINALKTIPHLKSYGQGRDAD